MLNLVLLKGPLTFFNLRSHQREVAPNPSRSDMHAFSLFFFHVVGGAFRQRGASGETEGGKEIKFCSIDDPLCCSHAHCRENRTDRTCRSLPAWSRSVGLGFRASALDAVLGKSGGPEHFLFSA